MLSQWSIPLGWHAPKTGPLRRGKPDSFKKKLEKELHDVKEIPDLNNKMNSKRDHILNFHFNLSEA